MNAYLVEGIDDAARLQELDEAARRAGEACRDVVRRGGRCSECGRPLIDSDALHDLLLALEVERPVAA